MIGKYRMRTDLAMENQEKFERDHVEISGVEIEKKKRKAEIQTTIVKITSEQGAKMMGKPKGTYVTIEAPLLLTADEEESRKAAEEFSNCLMEMVPEACGDDSVTDTAKITVIATGLNDATAKQASVSRKEPADARKSAFSSSSFSAQAAAPVHTAPKASAPVQPQPQVQVQPQVQAQQTMTSNVPKKDIQIPDFLRNRR